MATSEVRKRVRPVYLEVWHDKYGGYTGKRLLVFSAPKGAKDREVLEELPMEEYAPYIRGLPVNAEHGAEFKATWEFKIRKTRKKPTVEEETSEDGA